MKEQVCKYQRTLYEVDRKVHVSSCGNYKCIHHCGPVSRIICDDCSLREPPDLEDQRELETLDGTYNYEEIEARTPEERQAILETYCFKCKHLDTEAKVCQVCGCTLQAPIDEYAKYANFHCPLELW
jgi:hypothetical protein